MAEASSTAGHYANRLVWFIEKRLVGGDPVAKVPNSLYALNNYKFLQIVVIILLTPPLLKPAIFSVMVWLGLESHS